MTGIGGLLAGVAMLISAATISPAEQFSQLPLALAGTSFTGSATLEANASFVEAAYLLVKYGPLKAADSSSADANYTASVSIQGLPGETAMVTCNIASGAQKNKDCNGASHTVSHVVMGERKFDNGISLSRDFVAASQSSTSGGSISINLTYI